MESRVVPVMASQGRTEGTGNFRPVWVVDSDAKYMASGHTSPVLEISADSKELTCMGVVIDQIEGLGGSKYDDAGRVETADKELPVEQGSTHFDSQNPQDTKTGTPIMATVSRCLALDREDRYLGKKMIPDQFENDLTSLYRTHVADKTREPSKASTSRGLFSEWFERNKQLRIQGCTLEEHLHKNSKNVSVRTEEQVQDGSGKRLYRRLEDTVVTMARRLMVSERGHIGMAASRARRGDLICVLYGCSIPVLLRKVENGRYEFIGECYLDGFMDGEALSSDSADVQFRIV